MRTGEHELLDASDLGIKDDERVVYDADDALAAVVEPDGDGLHRRRRQRVAVVHIRRIGHTLVDAQLGWRVWGHVSNAR
jgi:hypothetical protein